MTDWTSAWDRDKYEVGRAMHEGWKRQKIANGFADHQYKPGGKSDGGEPRCLRCFNPRDRHHDDMTDWDALPEHQQAINFEGGREGFRLGYEAARNGPTYCAFCSAEYSADTSDDMLKSIQDHVRVCEYHPLAIENRRLRTELDEATP